MQNLFTKTCIFMLTISPHLQYSYWLREKLSHLRHLIQVSTDFTQSYGSNLRGNNILNLLHGGCFTHWTWNMGVSYKFMSIVRSLPLLILSHVCVQYSRLHQALLIIVALFIDCLSFLLRGALILSFYLLMNPRKICSGINTLASILPHFT